MAVRPGEEYRKSLKESRETIKTIYLSMLKELGGESLRNALEYWTTAPYTPRKTPDLMTQPYMAKYTTPTPIMLWGPPGIGKSESVFQAAHEIYDVLVGDFGLRLRFSTSLADVDKPDTFQAHFVLHEHIRNSGISILPPLLF